MNQGRPICNALSWRCPCFVSQRLLLIEKDNTSKRYFTSGTRLPCLQEQDLFGSSIRFLRQIVSCDGLEVSKFFRFRIMSQALPKLTRCKVTPIAAERDSSATDLSRYNC